MEILTSTSIALVGIAAGYGVLNLASKSKGFLMPLGYSVGALVIAGSFFTATVCATKCFSMYQKQCPMSDSWKAKAPVGAEAVKASAGG